MQRWPRGVLPVLAGLTLALGACSVGTPAPPQPPTGAATRPAPGGQVKSFELVAAPVTVQLGPGVRVRAWAYNGTVPGPPLRVAVGDLVRVRLVNHLPESTTIHWHGLALPNGQDGVAGLTQDPVPPGGSATYAFVASVPGTYWYHSHQDSAVQVDRGLYGVLIVEPRDPAPEASDRTIVFDEWPLGLEQPSPPPAADPAMRAYVTVAANGRAGGAVDPVRFLPGRPLRLRLVNAGYMVHLVRLDGAVAAVVAFDGHDVAGAPAAALTYPLGPGERIDLEVASPQQPARIRLQDTFPPAAEVSIPLLPEGLAAEGAPVPAAKPAPVLDLAAYPARAQPVWPAGGLASKRFDLELGERPSGATVRYEINGSVFPETGSLEVSDGDLVEITFVNRGRLDHPMHLHGHTFQLLVIDGRRPAGVIVKDTVLVRPGATVTIGFRADNPGWWMLHCHDLMHSAGGMMTLLRYDGAPRLAQLGGRFGGRPD